jgi:transposase
MKAMARQRSHSIAFKRQVAQQFIAGESLYALSKRHDISRQLIRVWVEEYEAAALDEDAQAADLLQEYEAKIAALERMVGRQALEIEFLNGMTTPGTTTAEGVERRLGDDGRAAKGPRGQSLCDGMSAAAR